MPVAEAQRVFLSPSKPPTSNLSFCLVCSVVLIVMEMPSLFNAASRKAMDFVTRIASGHGGLKVKLFFGPTTHSHGRV